MSEIELTSALSPDAAPAPAPASPLLRPGQSALLRVSLRRWAPGIGAMILAPGTAVTIQAASGEEVVCRFEAQGGTHEATFRVGDLEPVPEPRAPADRTD